MGRRQEIRDRALVGSAAGGGVLTVVAIGSLGHWLGTTAMTFVVVGLFVLTACGLAWLVMRMRTLGLRPPSLAEIRKGEESKLNEGS